MKKVIYTIILFTFSYLGAFAQQVGIGINNPHASAILDVSSSSKGLLAPRMTTAQRSAIVSPATGLLLYDTDNNNYWYYNGNSWNSIGSNNGGGLVLPYQASANTISPAFKITNSNTGAAIAGVTTHEYGVGVTGTTTSPYGWGINGFARSPGAIALYANADSATAIKATTVHGIGLDIISTNNSAIRVLNNNGQPAIQVSNVHMSGTAIHASTANNHAIVATSG
ncbi:MAG TPA: hypothetical protein VFX58_17145, partial [Chitinophagaceae bacterium]|nr:hypothetical protein [Chitinophagaceae bacterium]